MSEGSKRDDDRVADALLDILDQMVTTIRLQKSPAAPQGALPKESGGPPDDGPPDDRPQEVMDFRLESLKRVLESFGLQLAPHHDGEQEAARRLLAQVLRRASERGSSVEDAAPANRFAGAAEVRPGSQRGEAREAGTGGRRGPELSPELLRRALLGGVGKEQGARLIRDLRGFLADTKGAARDAVGEEANGQGSPAVEVGRPHRFLDPILLRAAQPAFLMIDHLLTKVSGDFLPLLEDIRLHFHEAGYGPGELRQSAGANSWHMRQFQKEVGMTAKLLIPECRMVMATSLLRETSKTVEQVAAAVGYDSARGLNDRCRKWCGFSPSGLRSREKALKAALGRLPADVFNWTFLERCRRGEVAPAELRTVLEHLEGLYGSGS